MCILTEAHQALPCAQRKAEDVQLSEVWNECKRSRLEPSQPVVTQFSVDHGSGRAPGVRGLQAMAGRDAKTQAAQAASTGAKADCSVQQQRTLTHIVMRYGIDVNAPGSISASAFR